MKTIREFVAIRWFIQRAAVICCPSGGAARARASAWPNEASIFRPRRVVWTLDGRGLYELVLDGAVREYFELSDDIPLGAGVAATYRFAGERLSARASEAFRQVVALTPDDLLIALSGGGVLRYKAGDGVLWRQDIAGDPWRLVDVDDKGRQLLGLDSGKVLRCLALDRGELRWEWSLTAQGTSQGGARHRDRRQPRLPSSVVGRQERDTVCTDTDSGENPRCPPAAGGRVLRSATSAAVSARARPGNRVVRNECLGLERRSFRAVGHGGSTGNRPVRRLEMPGTAGVSLLLRGTDGWYVVPVAAGPVVPGRVLTRTGSMDAGIGEVDPVGQRTR